MVALRLFCESGAGKDESSCTWWSDSWGLMLPLPFDSLSPLSWSQSLLSSFNCWCCCCSFKTFSRDAACYKENKALTINLGRTPRSVSSQINWCLQSKHIPYKTVVYISNWGWQRVPTHIYTKGSGPPQAVPIGRKGEIKLSSKMFAQEGIRGTTGRTINIPS